MDLDKQSVAIRLEKFLKTKKVKQISIARTLDLTTGYISNIISGTQPMPAKFIFYLVETFPELNIRWLLSGTGEMVTVEAVTKKEILQVHDPEVKYNNQPAPDISDLPFLYMDLERRVSRLEQKEKSK